ncbi:UDP-N-acetylglucosamine 1-carboxyvinyltransferase [Niveispirillum cyanobacteriorum]|uniref:UDP-N-acetylglucosamine 1-carboxyvinyltransferase n=1 Tax=Niveispirillum cyanobacteriorum TaxID=1612173 RepID=A0A2K9N735_9PROT|nr:UDP-N-acetylglucosamine 1-carboxyvinyltransferase [Niveispirillum cyanobacteriorum]AUN28917.1 UDP-N-acetylglucosamine 1-carboxyvinyltransferase [Niveispirillum cyanobacteriorum]GGE69215.1 UDP-N-acetylglucosamine 1-carboxyvinyltransferase [Niveispirillum cyanobacteriorum]
MDKLRIRGGNPLKGQITISGAKNAALPLQAACLLTDEKLTLTNLPLLADITTMNRLLAQHGVEVHINGRDAFGSSGRSVELDAADIFNLTAPYDLVRKMRASVLVLGPLLARFGQAKVSLPGGCAIGTRPVDLHIKGLQAMGAQIDIEGGYILAKAPEGGLVGAEFVFPQVSVGATENLMMAATLAKGETILMNAAREPEIGDLARCLIAMGAEIEGIGSDRLVIKGKDRLHGATYAVLPDRIEAGTFAMAAAITGGELELVGARMDDLKSVVKTLAGANVKVSETANGLLVASNGDLLGVDVMTEPFPGFPTDLQAQMMALMCVAKGASMITETIFENRFMHVPELTRMGANITVHGSSALVRGVPKLTGAPVMATDLRASVSLVLAGLAAQGETTVNRIYHLDRGYERVEAKLAACGADMERVKEED